MELAGLSEVAQILGVSRQRSGQLRKNADFPEPIATLLMGSVWRQSDIEEYAKTRNTRNGRPRVGSKKPVSTPLLGVVTPPATELHQVTVEEVVAEAVEEAAI